MSHDTEHTSIISKILNGVSGSHALPVLIDFARSTDLDFECMRRELTSDLSIRIGLPLWRLVANFEYWVVLLSLVIAPLGRRKRKDVVWVCAMEDYKTGIGHKTLLRSLSHLLLPPPPPPSGRCGRQKCGRPCPASLVLAKDAPAPGRAVSAFALSPSWTFWRRP